MKKKSEESALLLFGWTAIGVAALLFICIRVFSISLDKIMLPCVFHSLTDYYCPGCGGTRAIFLLLQGKVIKSFIYHPIVLYTVLVGGWFMISQSIEHLTKHHLNIGMKYRDGYLWVALGLVAVNFVIKNVALFFGFDLLY